MAMQGVYQSRASAGLQALPQGYMEAATAPGRHLAAGISSFGESMGEAIEAYKKGKAQHEYLNEEFEGLQEHLDDAEMGSEFDGGEGQTSFSASYPDDLAKDIAKFGEMGLSQKKAKIADLKFEIDRFYKERDFTQKKSQFDEQFELEKKGVDQRQENYLEGRGIEAERELRRRKEWAAGQGLREQEAMRLNDAQEANTERHRAAAKQAAAASEAYGLAYGAISPGESAFRAGSPQATDWNDPRKQALKVRGLSPEVMRDIGGMKPAAPTMGENVAAARQLFDQGAGVNPSSGLPFDAQELKTMAIRLHGRSKEDVEGINKAWDEKFGTPAMKPGDEHTDSSGGKWMATSDNSYQRIVNGRGVGASYSKELIEAAGDQIGRMHKDNKTFISFLETYLPRHLWGEAYEKRTAFLGSQRTEKFPSMSANRMQQLKSFDQRIMAYESQLADASDEEAVKIRADIARYEKKSKEVIEAHMKDARKRDANLPPGSGGLPTNTYNPRSDKFTRDK